jgi:thioredoxin 1
MSVTQITSKAQFDELLKANSYLALQATAAWCGPCKAITPLYNKHAESLAIPDKYAFTRVDIDDVPDLAFELGIQTIPAFYFFENGDKITSRYVRGANPPALKKAAEETGAQAKGDSTVGSPVFMCSL